jgi:predicted enzyme related to lactoylglutathione lyase
VAAPHDRNGKICYIELPATDVARSAEFYRHAFGWTIRRRGDGSTAFDDTTAEVSGTFVLDRAPSNPAGTIIFIMVADIVMTSEAIVDAGGEIVRPHDPAARDVCAHFTDPAGNVLGIYEERALKAAH